MLAKYPGGVLSLTNVTPLSNESRLSCGAELEGSRTEFYTTETGTLTAAW